VMVLAREGFKQRRERERERERERACESRD
jgi:hypothetical protein